MVSAPPGYRPSPRRSRRATTFVTVAAVAMAAAVILVVVLVELSSSGGVKSQLGEATFPAGRATELAPEVAARGPLLYPDLLGKDRPIYLQHLGPDPALGWVAVVAVAPGGGPRCVLRWQADHRFHDPCSAASFPADGSGLQRYPATVSRSDRITVDLRTPLPAATTVTTGTAPSTTGG